MTAARNPRLPPFGARLWLITDPSRGLPRTLAVVRAAGRALGPGGWAVVLRDKVSDEASVATWAATLAPVARAAGALFLVGDRPDLARDVRADGVHLPSHTRSLAAARRIIGDAIITVATHDDEDVDRAAREGADGVFVSPIFMTPGKGPPRGLRALATAVEIARRVTHEGRWGRTIVLGLGGVDVEGAARCAAAGADGVAVIRALLDAADPSAAARALSAPFEGA